MNKFTYALLATTALCTVAMAMPAVARDRTNTTISIQLGDAVFAYDDGYYDNARRWHDWRNEDERDWYRQNHRQTYYDMDRNEDRDNYRRDWLDGRRTDWRRDGRDDFSVTLGDVVFGYDDGYYDNGRRWHDWRNEDERDWYRQNHRQSYFQMSRYRDRDRYRRDWLDGRRTDWRRGGGDDFSITLGDVVFGYHDGYYDNGRRWHRWRNDNERNWYRQNHRQSYFQMSRYRDRDRYRRDWLRGRRADWRVGGEGTFSISLGNVVFGYSDGYYDNDRRWHNWRNDGERDWYRQNHSRTYYQMSRDRDNHRNRRDWREGRRDDWRDDGDRD